MMNADRVRRAWTVPGVNPRWHERQKARLRREWPVLAAALDKLEDGF